ncbi:MAG TPA: hypothetical protein VGX68_24645 [Thermoanaerobaculia bacterium]|nr:hypothetical protein [Thermoanaerobaculia bacterium]
MTADDPDQTAAAREVFETGELWICKTVLLETEWVLRYRPQAESDVHSGDFPSASQLPQNRDGRSGHRPTGIELLQQGSGVC